MIRKIALPYLIFAIIIGNFPLFGQSLSTSAPKPLASAESSPAVEDDRFPDMRDNAEKLKVIYQKTDTQNMDEIQRLLKTRVCQINRVGGLLARTIKAMREYYDAEITYWTKWNEVEQSGIEGQAKSLAEMQADQLRVKALVEDEQANRENLLRQRAKLEENPKRTQEIIRDIDSLVLDIKDSETRLADAEKTYEDVTTKVTNMNASMAARVVDMKQNLNRLEAWGLQMSAFYEKERDEAQEICNTKQPNTNRTVLPKAGPAQPHQ
jgi:seryl-tRNA synthetase